MRSRLCTVALLATVAGCNSKPSAPVVTLTPVPTVKWRLVSAHDGSISMEIPEGWIPEDQPPDAMREKLDIASKRDKGVQKMKSALLDAVAKQQIKLLLAKTTSPAQPHATATVLEMPNPKKLTPDQFASANLARLKRARIDVERSSLVLDAGRCVLERYDEPRESINGTVSHQFYVFTKGTQVILADFVYLPTDTAAQGDIDQMIAGMKIR
jgi:hypothetical protein